MYKLNFKLGFGFSDVENGVEASPKTVMRIASISKAMTSVALGLLMDQERVPDLDVAVSDIVSEWPKV